MIVNSQEKLSQCIGDLREAFKEHPYLQVTIKSGAKRSLDANALAWVWYQQIARELGEDTPDGVHNECKLTLGVPILRAEEPEFRAVYDRVLKHRSYEDKLAIIKYMPITSIMRREQMRQYLDDMQRTYAQRGVILESLEAP